MSDHFEEAKDDILFRTQGNGGPSTRDLLTAMGALAQDVDEAISALAAEQRVMHEASQVAMKEHITYADVRDERLTALEAKAEDWERNCPMRLDAALQEAVQKAVEESKKEHAKTHERYVSSLKQKPESAQQGEFPTGDKRTLFEVILAWGIVKWLVAGVVMAGIAWSVSYWASSCAAEKVEKQAIQTEMEQHTPAANTN